MMTAHTPRLTASLALIGLIFAGALFVQQAVAQTAPANGPATKAAGPLTATLIPNQDTYTLDPAQSGQAFRDQLEAARKANRPAPAAPPKVDLILRLTNNTDKPITLSIGGDESQIILKLQGPGAVTIPNLVAMTMEFRMGTPVTLAPGKTYDIAIRSLAFGQRGISEFAFWTEPGDYSLAATLIAAQGNSQVTISSEPVKLKVVEARN